jgi:thioredoxin reductase (NADPH)
VVGGANSAGQAALYLARFASEVVMIVRGDSLAARMSQYLVDRIAATPNIAVRTRTTVEAASGEPHLESIRIAGPDGTEELSAAGMFVFVGAQPRTDWLEGDIVRDELGFVVTGPALRADRWSLERDPFLLETSLPGVFAVGDVRSRSVKRIASAVGEGAIAVQFVHEVLRGV